MSLNKVQYQVTLTEHHHKETLHLKKTDNTDESNSCEIDIELPENGKSLGQFLKSLNSFGLPKWAKNLIREAFGNYASHSHHPGHSGKPLPSESKAAKTINSFQKSVLGGKLISVTQMQQMANTGYITKEDGSTVAVPPDVQQAAKRFMADGGAFFKKMESAANGKLDGRLGISDYTEALKDGKISSKTSVPIPVDIPITYRPYFDYSLPSASSAAKTIYDFQRLHLNHHMLSSTQMKQMADTGYLTKDDGSTILVPANVQEAAKRFMAHNSALFKKMESATDGNCDGMLAPGDYYEALRDGTVSASEMNRITITTDNNTLPSSFSAAHTIKNFQHKRLGDAPLTSTQMQQIADTGYLTKNDGTTIAVPSKIQDAAKRFMANGAELFKQVESNVSGTHDGVMTEYDISQALKHGNLSENDELAEFFERTGAHVLPSSCTAARTIRDFQHTELGDAPLTSAQMQQMASTGYLTRNGKMIAVPAEVQNSAKRFMANGAELFKAVESNVSDTRDGIMTEYDISQALKNGTIPKDNGRPEIVVSSDEYELPSSSSAAHTIKAFQHAKLGDAPLSSTQMQEMADTGYLTINGKTIAVSSEVQDAARRFMAHDARLFKEVESNVSGKMDGILSEHDIDEALENGTIPRHHHHHHHSHHSHHHGRPSSDGYELPSSSDAAHTIKDFQHAKLGDAPLTSAQMQQMASTGYLTINGKTIAVSPEVQDAARRFMAHDARLFKEVESNVSGTSDGIMTEYDIEQALKHKTIPDDDEESTKTCIRNTHHHLPSSSRAAHTINDFQHTKLGGAPLSAMQMRQMADTGYLTINGKTIAVSYEVQQAARRLMANGSELFKKIESATDGNFDGWLAESDYIKAIKEGAIAAAA